jgi:hypothetical protein
VVLVRYVPNLPLASYSTPISHPWLPSWPKRRHRRLQPASDGLLQLELYLDDTYYKPGASKAIHLLSSGNFQCLARDSLFSSLSQGVW